MTKREVIGVVLGFAAIGALLMALPADAASGDLGPSQASMVNKQGEQRVDTSANTDVTAVTWCLGTDPETLSTVLSGRKDITFQNPSAIEIYLDFDGETATSTAGVVMEASNKTPISFGYGSNIAVSAVAASAMSGTTCLRVRQAK